MTDRTKWSSMLLTVAALVVVVAGIRAAHSIVVPFLVAAFLAVILTPTLRWLERRGLPTSLAIVIIVAGVLLLSAGLVVLVTPSAEAFQEKRELYQKGLGEQLEEGRGWFVERGLVVPGGEDASLLDPQAVFRWSGIMLRELGNVFTLVLIAFIGFAFMLLESSRFPAKFAAAFGSDHPAVTHLKEILDDVRQYMVIKTVTSLVTGLMVVGFTYLMGIPYPLLWGVLAFLLNYIPFIGSTLAGVPAVLLALALHGVGPAIATIAGYLVINNLVSNVIEPVFMGQGLGISTFVVFVSIVFWGWVLGPWGMLLATPLTMVCKIVLAEYEETRWIALLISSKAPASAKSDGD